MSTGYVAQLFLSIFGFQIRNLAESLKNLDYTQNARQSGK
jgi:hypothetical protein